jgi:PAS domain S-box-containing protein
MTVKLHGQVSYAGGFMNSSYSSELVVLSILIACVASYAALHLSAHVATTRSRFGWLVAGATAMGIGIWSMHFIAMLAYRLPVGVGYNPPLVALSLTIAIVASAIGLEVAGRSRPSHARIALAGPVMGLAIAGMHYTGMAAMRLPASQHYDLRLVVASLVIAVAASYAAIALFLRFRFERSRRGAWLKGASAIVMGHAVAGMHYTGMAAVHFTHATARDPGLILPPHQLAFAVAASTAVVLMIIVAGAMLDRWAGTLRAVRESEERFRIMVDAVRDYAIVTIDTEGRIGSWNRGAERLLGYSAREILGQSLCRFYPDSDKADGQRELAIAAETGQYEREGVQVLGKERVVFANVTTTAMRDDRGELIGYARILRDVTDKLRAEEELRQSEKQLRHAQKMEAVGQLAGGVAHDFNNMLTAIRGYTDLLLEDDVAPVERDEALREIRKAADRAASLTRQLLAFSRKQVLQPRAVNPNVVVGEMDSMLRRLLVGDVDLVTTLDADVDEITVDPAQLEQVVLNLVVNARDAMPGGGSITIETANVDLDQEFCRTHPTAQLGPHVVLTVSDTGEGMSEEIRRHIFEPFFTTKERGAGTGLGLSMVYGIVKQSGGHIWVYSEPGLGSVFRIYFPRSSTACAAPPSAVAAATPMDSDETVLLVDDEDGVRRMVATLLERQGYRVLTARDGVEAIEVSERHAGRIDLLITDMMMPRMHGKDVSERLAVVRPEMRTLFMSGYADDHIIDRGLLDARMSFIQKPFALSELIAKIRTTVGAGATIAG